MIVRRPSFLPAIALLILLATPLGSAAPARPAPGAGAPFHGVTGAVVRPDGTPVAGVRVELSALPSSYEWGRMVLGGRTYGEPATATATDRAGRFALTAPGAGLWTVVVQAPGFVPLQYAPLAVVEPVELPPAVLIEDVHARFQVISPDGTPAAGVWLYAASEASALRAAAGWAIRPRLGLTAADGTLELPRARRERLTALAVAGAATVKGTGLEGGRLALPAVAGDLRTIEVQGAEGRPVPGVQIRLGDIQGPAAVTGEDGRVRLAVPAGVPARVRLLAADGRRWTGMLPAGKDPVRLTLPPAASLAGRAIDSASRKPLAGALVWLAADPGAFARTDAQGGYGLAAIELEGSALQAEAAGHLPLSRRFAWTRAGSLHAPTLALDPAAAVAGLVVDGASKPLAGARVQAVLLSWDRARSFSRSGPADPRATAGPDGRFLLARLLAGETWELRALLPGWAPARISLSGLAPGKTREGVRLVLGRGRTASGRVIDRSGQPVPGAGIFLAATTGERAPAAGDPPAVPRGRGNGVDSWSAVAGADGRFTVVALPAGRVDLRVAREGFAAVTVRAVPIPAGEGPCDLGTVILEPGAEVRGAVVDREGKPVSGAEVYAGKDLRRLRFATDAGVPIDRKPEATTGSDGRFILSDLRRGERLDLEVRAAGYRPGNAAGVPAPTARPLRIVLDRGVRVAGRVVDAGERPVAGAELELRSERPGGERGIIRHVGGATTRTAADADGRFVFDGVPPGGATLDAWAAGFQPAQGRDLRLPPEGVDGLKVELDRGAVIEGRVRTSAGDPVEDARVVCGSAAAISDADGFYRLEGLPTGRRKVQLLHRDYLPFDRELDVRPGDNPLDLVLAEGREVEGRVVDRAGEGIAAAEIALFPAGSPREQTARSGADGAFRFPNVQAGVWSLRVGKEGYLPTEAAGAVTVTDAPVRGVVIRLDRGARIAGRILKLDLYDLAEVEVRARRDDGTGERSGRVNFQGAYEIADLGPGEWVVTAELRGGTREARGRVDLEPGQEEARLDLELGGRLTLTGRVLYGGEPLAGASLSLRGRDVTAARQVATDWEGAFRVEDLQPGAYRLQVVSQRELLNHSEELRLDSDRDLLVQIAAVPVSGTVVDSASAEPLPDAVVSLRRLAGGEAAFLITIATDADGYFALPAVTEGRYRLTATREGYAPNERELDVGAASSLREMKIPLDPAAGLDLDVRLASGRRPPRVTAAVLDGAGRQILFETRPVDGAGRVRFSTVPAGSWSVLVAAPGGALVAVPARVPGGIVPAVLPDAGRLTVRVPALGTSDAVAALTVTGADGTFLRNLSPDGTVRATWEVLGGRAVVDGVPAGVWTVRATAPDGRVWSASATTGGADQEVSLN
ncbi:MAG TPA: carboxypeptidase-like regulatory domain-containing protein [Thermoanaerobaculia bacterium]|nr:carboxypeptidase-like regulatory domain-containing protein [Thermoanaerobaculia bacterium]